ncbi:V-type ATPase subunit [Peptoniphilus catoniae]|uniref:V-type ATPase subunit n=1 Tax=Peptoniphilus catoniae TaxID=1660341 RepID=UPI0010FE7070|nr:V-type ATPase subunit [Peptoniphilus catoniae]
MSFTSKFDAIDAKLSAMNAKLLKDEDFIELAHKDNLQEILNYLKDKDYYKELNSFDSIYEAEEKLNLSRISKIKKLIHYLSGPYKDFAKALLREFEIRDLKKIIRTIYLNEDIKDLKNRLLILEPGDLSELKGGSLESFVNSLNDSLYYKTLNPYKDIKEDVVLFYMEMNLDRLFYSELYNISKDFSKRDRENFSLIYGQRIDLLNIRWIYRGLKYYDLYREELINFSMLGGYYYNYDDLRELCYKETTEDFINEVKKSPYGFLFEGDKVDIYMDRRAGRYLYYLAKSNFTKKEGFIKFMTFVFLLEYEVKDIEAIMESIRFNLTFAQTLQYLFRSYKEVK